MNDVVVSSEEKSGVVIPKGINPHNLPCPAFAYLNSLNSVESQRAMKRHIYKACLIMWKTVPEVVSAKSIDETIYFSPWRFLTRDIVHKLLRELKKTKVRYGNSYLSPATVNAVLTAIKGVALEAKLKKIIDGDTYSDIKTVRSIKGVRVNKGRALDLDEITALFQHCQNDKSNRGVRDHAIISVLIGAGLRRSEIVGLQLDDVNFKTSEIRVIGKGDKEAYQPVSESVLDSVAFWIDQVRLEASGPLFYRIRRHDFVTNEGLTDQAIYTILEERGLKLNLEKFTPHDLRRTYATWLLEGGEDLVVVRDMMRHSSILTTQKYRIVERKRMHKAASKLKIPS